MIWALPALGAALALAQSVASGPIAQEETLAPRQLRPIHVRDYEASFGLHRRASEQFSSLEPQTQSQLVYGSPLENEQLLLANLTLYAPDGLPIVLLEEFDDLTSAIDCDGADGMMSLTFKSQDAFDYAMNTWNYVNQNADSKFLVIANHEGCGPDDQRQPYIISGIREEASTFTTYLTAQTAPWSDIAGSYDLDFGKALPFQRPDSLQTRDLSKRLNFNKGFSIGINAGTPNKKMPLLPNITDLPISCVNCYIAGSLEVTLHASVGLSKLKGLTIDGVPHGLHGAMEMEAQFSKNVNVLNFTQTLFSAPVPDLGFEILDIFKIGAILSYDVGVSATLSGSATIDFGLDLTVPNTASIHADIMSSSASTANGLSGDVKPVFDVKSIDSSVKFTAFAAPKLSFGIDLAKAGNLDIALVFKMPQIDVEIDAGYDDSGFCSNDSGASKTGVEIKPQIGLELDLQIDVPPELKSLIPFTQKELWSHYWALNNLCFPIAIPGLIPVTSTHPSLPASTSTRSHTSLSAPTSATTQRSHIPSSKFSTIPVTALSSATKPIYLPSGAPSATGISGIPSGIFPTGGRASSSIMAIPYPIRPSASGFTKLPSGSGGINTMPQGTGTASRGFPRGTGTASRGIYPPRPTGSGSGSGSGFQTIPRATGTASNTRRLPPRPTQHPSQLPQPLPYGGPGVSILR